MGATGKTIAALACSNGLGHTRRLMSISSFMLKNGFNVKIDLYVSDESLRILSKWPELIYLKSNQNVNFINFIYPNCQSERIDNIEQKNWCDIDLPDLSDYDLVWSDNVLQVLSFRPDAIISGSFFWYEVFTNLKNKSIKIKKFIQEQKKLIKLYEPHIAGNEYFATPAVRKNTNFVPVGLYRYNTSFSSNKSRSILLSCGLGGEEIELSKNALLKILNDNLKPPDYLYVEPRILPNKYPKWIKIADFSAEMFNNCVAACIRPGLGTVSDSLINNIRIFSFSNPDSFEMEHNGKIIEELGLGEYNRDPFVSYINALEYSKDDALISLQEYKTLHLRTDGIFATAKFILNKL